MKAALRNATRTALLALAVSSDAGPSLGTQTEQPRLLPANSSDTLAAGLNLGNGSSVSWNVAMPSSGTIRLSFDARIDYVSTAGNSTILEIQVNGTPVTASHLANKHSTYTYLNRAGTESYYENRGSAWDQATSYWGLFWSPDFVANNRPTDYYHVQGGNAFTYVLTISGLVVPGQVNTIRMVNQGGWVQTATGNSPIIVLRDVIVTAS